MKSSNLSLHFHFSIFSCLLGAKFNKVGSQVKIVDDSGRSSTQFVNSDGSGLAPGMKIMWDHFQQCLEECKTREKLLDEISSSTGLSMFPNRIGERPSSSKKAETTPINKKSPSEVGGRSSVSIFTFLILHL